jgi:hypothetical protein
MLAPVVFADGSQSPDESPAPLSVAPLDVIDYPQDRPSWVSQPLQIDKDSRSIVVVSGPCDTREESIEELRLMRRAAVSTYVSLVCESGGQYDFYPISDEEIDAELVRRSYAGTVTQGDMKMYEDAVELRFTDDQRQEIEAAWKNVEVRDRLGTLGFLVFSGLVMLICSSALVGVASRRVERREKMAATD